MKRVYIAVTFLIIAVFLCTAEQKIVEKTYSNSTQLIEQALQATKEKDYNEAQRLCSRLNEVWQTNYPLMSAMVDHGCLEDASLNVSMLEELAKNKSDSLSDVLIELKNQVKSIYEGQKITFGNIF